MGSDGTIVDRPRECRWREGEEEEIISHTPIPLALSPKRIISLSIPLAQSNIYQLLSHVLTSFPPITHTE
jgi:hypothetical protein